MFCYKSINSPTFALPSRRRQLAAQLREPPGGTRGMSEKERGLRELQLEHTRSALSRPDQVHAGIERRRKRQGRQRKLGDSQLRGIRRPRRDVLLCKQPV